MKKIYTSLNSAQKSLGAVKPGVSATGGGAKILHKPLEWTLRLALGTQKLGVTADILMGDIVPLKETMVAERRDAVKAYKSDVKDLRKALKKAKKKDRKGLEADIKKTLEAVAYYEDQLSRARKL